MKYDKNVHIFSDHLSRATSTIESCYACEEERGGSVASFISYLTPLLHFPEGNSFLMMERESARGRERRKDCHNGRSISQKSYKTVDEKMISICYFESLSITATLSWATGIHWDLSTHEKMLRWKEKWLGSTAHREAGGGKTSLGRGASKATYRGGHVPH